MYIGGMLYVAMNMGGWLTVFMDDLQPVFLSFKYTVLKYDTSLDFLNPLKPDIFFQRNSNAFFVKYTQRLAIKC